MKRIASLALVCIAMAGCDPAENQQTVNTPHNEQPTTVAEGTLVALKLPGMT
jgi:hypothetical protein